MVHRVETNAEAAGLPGLGGLLAAADAGDAGEVVVGEGGVIVGEQGGALPLRERRAEQRVGAVGAAVKAEEDPRGPCVIGVLDELPQRGGALRVVGQHLAFGQDKSNPIEIYFLMLTKEQAGNNMSK